MIAAAGGVVPGGADVVTLVGTRNGEPVKLDIDLPAILQSGRAELDVQVENGDIIYVDRAPTIYIYGEVQRPGQMRLERGMTLMQALAAGGGLTRARHRARHPGAPARHDRPGQDPGAEAERSPPTRRRRLRQGIPFLRGKPWFLASTFASSGRTSGSSWACSWSSPSAGITTTLLWPKQYTAEASLIVEMRIDPALGALAPALAAPSYMATQIEVLQQRAGRVEGGHDPRRRALADGGGAVARSDRRPRFRSNAISPTCSQRGLAVEPTRGSNLINISLHLRRSEVRPGRGQRLRPGLHGRLGRPAGRAGAPVGLVPRGPVEGAARQPREGAGDAVGSSSRPRASSSPTSGSTRKAPATRPSSASSPWRRRSGSTPPPGSATPAARPRPTCCRAASVQSLKSQLAAAQTRLSEASNLLGKNHPTRQQLEVQVAELQRQLAAEIRRVSGGTSVSNRGSSQKVAELQTLVDEQKKLLLALRADKDQIAVYLRDVEAAQRAYDAVAMRLTPDQHGRAEQPGQHPPAQPRGRAARAVAAEDPGRHRRLAPRRPGRRPCRGAGDWRRSTVASADPRT